jgi:hypothetical protein
LLAGSLIRKEKTRLLLILAGQIIAALLFPTVREILYQQLTRKLLRGNGFATPIKKLVP